MQPPTGVLNDLARTERSRNLTVDIADILLWGSWTCSIGHSMFKASERCSTGPQSPKHGAGPWTPPQVPDIIDCPWPPIGTLTAERSPSITYVGNLGWLATPHCTTNHGCQTSLHCTSYDFHQAGRRCGAPADTSQQGSSAKHHWSRTPPSGIITAEGDRPSQQSMGCPRY